ncbi:uncharacterized mitochondrial protein AtMg00810-like [Rutidosis leptorrhynchoides]|uniref:uncharacterized mitochondrial protein AtMg00810-like n=1 Tax=Rutidosis leptorrhynchoides TaxID=125765 RepID=UPI003A99F67F
MCLFKNKFNAYGNLSRYTSRIIANGRSQQIDADCDETFSPVVKSETIRIVLSLAILGTGYAQHLGLHQNRCDTSLFIYQHGSGIAYLLLYVDAIVLTTSSTNLLHLIIQSLHKEFSMTHLGPMNYFLASQHRVLPLDPTLYGGLAGVLHYLTFTHPDISYAVQQMCLFMYDLREQHLHALKWIVRYVQRTLNMGLQLYALSLTTLVSYFFADWAGCSTTKRSTFGYCIFLGLRSSILLFLAQVPRQNIKECPMMLLRHAGYIIFFVSFTAL